MEHHEPERAVDPEPDPRRERDASEHLPGPVQPHGQRLRAVRDRCNARSEQRATWAPVEREHTADDRAGTKAADQHRPRPRATEIALGDNWPEHEQRCAREVADPEEHDRRPDPRLLPEGVPSFAQLAEKRLRLHAVAAWLDRDAPEQHGSGGEARRVDEDCRAGAAERDEDATDRRPDEAED